MKLRCVKLIRSNDGYGGLTIGKIYELDKIGKLRYYEDVVFNPNKVRYVGSYSSLYLKGDDNIHRYYMREAFVDIQQEREEKLKQLGI